MRSNFMKNAAITTIVAGILSAHAWAQRDDDSPAQRDKNPPAQPDDRGAVEDAVRAMDMDGQLRLGGAIEIAERHAKGRAVRASVELAQDNRNDRDSDSRRSDRSDDNNGRDRSRDSNQPTRGNPDANPNRGGGINNPNQDESDRNRDTGAGRGNDSALVFEVLVFANGQMKAVRIDGRSRQVISDDTRRTLDPVKKDDDDDDDDDDNDDDDDDDNDRERDDRRSEKDKSESKESDKSESKPDETPKQDQPNPDSKKDDDDEKPN